jgi:hypothetical protein
MKRAAPGYSVRASLLRSAGLDLRDFPVDFGNLGFDIPLNSSKPPLLR